MAPLRKHGAHYVPLDLPGIGAGAASDTSTLFTYQANPADWGVLDPTQEYVLDATLTTDGAVTGAATNNFAVDVKHYNSSGVLQNRILYTFGNGVNAAAFTPITLFGGVAGALTNPTGTTIPGWALQPGDSIVVKRTSNGTGLASPAFTVTLLVGPKS